LIFVNPTKSNLCHWNYGAISLNKFRIQCVDIGFKPCTRGFKGMSRPLLN